ncbi:alpha-N-acetylgalactosaminide alpha-2,6-sialyltransferase 3-like protein [Cricetulus griseus]|nr:alpha-N-acetylgalactosaminide alpha-2,6-sialyltransferase 3-like protein [Cricetulus griseus]
MIPQKSELKRFFMIRRFNERKSVLVVSFIALCLLLLALRLINDMNFPLLLNCFGPPETKWTPLSYTFRQPLRTHYGYINVRTQEVWRCQIPFQKALSVMYLNSQVLHLGLSLNTWLSSFPNTIFSAVHVFECLTENDVFAALGMYF